MPGRTARHEGSEFVRHRFERSDLSGLQAMVFVEGWERVEGGADGADV